MKKFIQLLSAVIICLSCTEKIDIDDTQISPTTNKTSRGIGDGAYEALGLSYDITEDYLGENAVKLKVIDIEAFVNDHKDRFYNPFSGIIDQRIYAGENAESLLHDIINRSNFSGSVAAMKKNNEEGFFSGTIKSGFDSRSKYSY